MSDAVWSKAIAGAPVPERARRAHGQLLEGAAAEALRRADENKASMLCRLWSGSDWATELLVKHPGWLNNLCDSPLAEARLLSEVRRELNRLIESSLSTGSFSEALARVRQFKQQEMIRIAARDLARLGPTTEIILELSNVADVCLSAVLGIVLQQHQARFGRPHEQDPGGRWRESKFCVLGLGKLGGQELNYSSDVDVLFVYSDEGGVFKEAPAKGKSSRPGLSNHEFFKRIAESFIAEVGRLTSDGMLFRIDLRLRPEGEAGPLVRSLAGYENYYAQWGQTWERMMLIKARGVAGDIGLAGEFLEMIQPFRYPRSVGTNVLGEIAAVKQRIESEVVKSGEMDRNVKLGRGGIREIEFVAQALQILHAGKNPFLQGAQTLPVLQKLAQYDLLEKTEVADLSKAYAFLRDVEHRLQMDQNRQTHSLPVTPAARDQIGRLMGYDGFAPFEKARLAHAGRVRAVYDRVLKMSAPEGESELPRRFEEDDAEWQVLLERHSFREPARAARLLREFALGPGYGHVSTRTTELALRLIPRLLSFCPPQGGKKDRLSDPDRVVARLDAFVSAYGARATLYEMWSSNTPLFELMLFLFDRSEFLAEVAIRTPDLVDELVLSGHLQRRKTAAIILEELCHGVRDADQRLWIRRYHQSELMRIGLRDILGLADYEQNFEELSALADACLEYALDVVLRKNRIKSPPFAIIGWGKLGGVELNYGSDLDITFVAPDSARQLPRLQSLAASVMDLLSSPTEYGVAFVTDARLRPDGEKGLLVNTVRAYEDYYRRRAMLWEIQSLTRTRFIAGHEGAGKRFQEVARGLTDFSKMPAIAAFTPDWRGEVSRMRARIEKERTPAGKDALAIKTGTGGLIDAEFLAQVLCLEHGWHEANTLAVLRHAGSEGWLKKAPAQKLIENFRRLRRVEAILRRWSYAGETVLPDDPAPLYRVAVRCGFPNAEEFMRAIGTWRSAIRGVYASVLGKAAAAPKN